MEKFANISTKSEDKKLQKFYKNFQRLIDFIENRGIYVENSEFYDKKISEINEKISENFHEKYDKNAKNIIVKNFREIVGFLGQKHNLHTKNKFMLIFMMLGMSIGIGMFAIFMKDNPQFFAMGQGSGVFFGILLGLIIDKKIEKENRQIPVGLSDEN